ncbi:MAG: hypothetical protein J7M25_02355 [Deltaproteobacteria bacterium]|nr:hypothetical protein [Deltaproteobacteria bacterium]
MAKHPGPDGEPAADSVGSTSGKDSDQDLDFEEPEVEEVEEGEEIVDLDADWEDDD